MHRKPRHLALLLIAALLAAGIFVPLAPGSRKNRQDSSVTQMDERKRALHVLNRLSFGPRPGDVERVLSMGVDKWIEQQLRPEKIDDRALDVRLSPFRTLRMSTDEMVENFPPRQLIKAVEDGKQAMPSDPLRRSVYEAQLLRYE
jgi:Protein of unknown function (DUF1800)